MKLIRERWYAGAGEMAAFLASLNPNWNATVWQELLERPPSTWKSSLMWELYRQEYELAVAQYEEAYNNEHQIADYTIEGLAKQFQLPLLKAQSPSA